MPTESIPDAKFLNKTKITLNTKIMESDKFKELTDFIKKLETAGGFNSLKPHQNINDLHKAELYFSGYNDLILTIIDIIKVCSSALHAMNDLENSPTAASVFNISEVLGIAIKLMPIEETKIIDDCYKLHIRLKESLEGTEATE